MNPVVLDKISFSLDQESLIKELYVKGSFINQFKKLMEEAIAIAKPKANPVAFRGDDMFNALGDSPDERFY